MARKTEIAVEILVAQPSEVRLVAYGRQPCVESIKYEDIKWIHSTGLIFNA